MDRLLAGIGAFCAVLQVTHSLKCYAGFPHQRRECVSASYCLTITTRNGRMQWSCDGNSFNQLSLCSSAGLDGPRHTIYEAPSRDSSTYFRPSEPSRSDRDRLYFVKQQVDPRLTQFVSDGGGLPPTSADALSSSDASGHRAAIGRRNGKRCFDAGDLGRICCCASGDFCNGDTKVGLRVALWVAGASCVLRRWLQT